MDNTALLLFVTATFVLAGFVKGVIGLGLPTIAVGILGVVMAPAQAAALLVVPNLITNGWQIATGPKLLATLRRLWPMLLAICLGTWAGAGLLQQEKDGTATLWLGAALILVSLAHDFNLSAAIVESAWALIAGIGLIRLAAKR